jgi:phosphatidylglycerophosphate synthase
MTKPVRFNFGTLLYVPQLIGWLRVAMMVAGFYHRGNPLMVAGSYLASLTLDMVDGAAARALDQTSRFGEVLDVTIDCFSRTFLWVLVASMDSERFSLLGAFLVSMDWLTFVCAQAMANASSTHWKVEAAQGSNWLVEWAFSNNFRNVPGALANVALNILPATLYLELSAHSLESFDLKCLPLEPWTGTSGTFASLSQLGSLLLPCWWAGIVLCTGLQCYVVHKYLLMLLAVEPDAQ